MAATARIAVVKGAETVVDAEGPIEDRESRAPEDRLLFRELAIGSRGKPGGWRTGVDPVFQRCQERLSHNEAL